MVALSVPMVKVVAVEVTLAKVPPLVVTDHSEKLWLTSGVAVMLSTAPTPMASPLFTVLPRASLTVMVQPVADNGSKAKFSVHVGAASKLAVMVASAVPMVKTVTAALAFATVPPLAGLTVHPVNL